MFRMATMLGFMVASLVVAAAGCGGSDVSGSTGGASGEPTPTASSSPAAVNAIAPSSLSKAEFVKRANGICGRRRGDWRRGFKYFVQERQPGGGRTRGEAVVEAVKVIEAPTVRIQTEEIRDLGAPPGGRKQVEELVLAFEGAEEAALRLSSMKGKAAVDRLYIWAGQLAKRYGLDECASPLAR